MKTIVSASNVEPIEWEMAQAEMRLPAAKRWAEPTAAAACLHPGWYVVIAVDSMDRRSGIPLAPTSQCLSDLSLSN